MPRHTRDGWPRFVRAHWPPQALAQAAAAGARLPAEVYLSDWYQVVVDRQPAVSPGWPRMIHLSIKRRDREPVRDWRHFQRIKNDLVGPEHEAVELYPAESRLMDQANQYHLWVLADPALRFPFGAQVRDVTETPGGAAKQRPFNQWEPRP